MATSKFPTRERLESFLAGWWARLSWKGKTLVCCVAYLALNAAVVVYGTLSQKPAKPDTVSGLKTVAEQPAEPKLSNLAATPPQSAAQSPPPPAAQTLDPRIAGAYTVQRRFVTAYSERTEPAWELSSFSSPEQTTIVQHGNQFRIKGWWVRSFYESRDHNKAQTVVTTYLCELQFDPELEVWHLVGDIEPISEILSVNGHRTILYP